MPKIPLFWHFFGLEKLKINEYISNTLVEGLAWCFYEDLTAVLREDGGIVANIVWLFRVGVHGQSGWKAGLCYGFVKGNIWL